ncbi:MULTISPECIES: TraX family protein [Clostridium]|uniref:F pilin acetylation protein n=1 Tax=Clostridium botulinum (strain Eklund 17B / Type B) TaxID=935198 RepID=B2THI3_CLOBB|nr:MULTISPECIES: TraX family protein [Clostridium]ACD22877.1 putative F pilin acetylation protein [Clostridium botulinum B str. Eklund 17B (NRP)]MBN1038053.1 conjugal transfer protein TraX [Clostridium botulinum]MBY6975049.1 conjugal transfer protein TraX [Clostridium botulinum]MBY7000029.1 conjugal transfer protein TraX [Clostridium botulinum]MCR1274802.1 conjugal transfer protein TraX [Clostridium botulinum]
MKKLNSFTLKIFAIIAMIMDHIFTYLRSVPIDVPLWFSSIGKLASPIFFYLIVEGFFHTKSRKRYFLRLAIFGGVMIILDTILGIHNNIFLSLSLSVLLLICIEYFRNIEEKKKKILLIIPILGIGFLYFNTEASIFGFVETLIFYFCREKKVLLSILFVSFYGLFLATVLQAKNPLIFTVNNQWMSVFAIIPILMYNGKLGLKNTFTKWMFYIVYPLHLTIIILLRNALM